MVLVSEQQDNDTLGQGDTTESSDLGYSIGPNIEIIQNTLNESSKREAKRARPTSRSLAELDITDN